MANPTTYFGWVMPTATDLVTDLPADFNVFGQGVDTSLQDLLGGTTGQVLKKNSNTDMDFVWGADSAGMTNPMTTTGDIIYSSSGSTPARLGIGSTGQVVTVSGGVPTWATPASGSMTLLSTTTLSGASTTISSISASYINLYLVVTDYIPSTGNETIRLRVNGDTASNYAVNEVSGIGTSFQNNTIFFSDARTTGTASHNIGTITFPDYANTTNYKNWNSDAWADQSNAGYWGHTIYSTYYKGTIAAISSITFFVSSGTFTSGTVKVYGVN